MDHTPASDTLSNAARVGLESIGAQALGKLVAEGLFPKDVSGPTLAVDQFASRAMQLFPQIDIDDDGFLSDSELSDAVENRAFKGEDAQVVAALTSCRSDLEDLSNDEWFWENDGITKDDLKEFDNDGEGQLRKDVIGLLERTAKWQSEKICYDLYADADNPSDSIKPDAIKQGTIGDCFFLAAVGSLAATNPESIREMIKDNGDGTCTVTFPGAPDEPQTVAKPTETELGLYNGGTARGVWACVLEKAYGQFVGGGDTPQESIEDGGSNIDALGILTGRDVDDDRLFWSSKAEVARKLKECFDAVPPRPVTAGISSGWFSDDEQTIDGFDTGHAYSILAFDACGPDGGTVTVRNPWGKQDGTGKGEIEISLSDFMKNFTKIQYSESD